MEAEITNDWIDRYNDGELDEKEKAIFQQRMLANPLLRSEVYIDACLIRFLMDFEMQDLMEKIRSASQRNSRGNRFMDYLLIVASIFCLSMIGGIFYLLRSSTETAPIYFLKQTIQHDQGAKIDPDKLNGVIPYQKTTHQGLVKKNFESLAEYELLIGSGTRSDQFKLISPHVNASIPAGSEIMFKWLNTDKKALVSIVFLNNHGITVSEIELNQTSSYVLKTKGFKPGLYYWKIMADDEMVMMGKLTIL